MSMDQIQEFRCPLSPVGETPLSPAHSASKWQRHRHINKTLLHLQMQRLKGSLYLQSPGREPTWVGGPWRSSHPPRWCVAPATLNLALRPVAALQNFPLIPLSLQTPHLPIIPATNHIPQRQQGATVTSDPVPLAPPNHPLRAMWSDCEWRKGGNRRGKKKKKKEPSAPHRWKQPLHLDHQGRRLTDF